VGRGGKTAALETTTTVFVLLAAISRNAASAFPGSGGQPRFPSAAPRTTTVSKSVFSGAVERLASAISQAKPAGSPS
jgi:hypothetical protein